MSPPASPNTPVDRLAWTALACDPQRSIVVEACAGSGKTWLLTARLFRLLLAGARPEHILAITFTRKAAEEMQSRLHALLQECALANPAQLVQLLSERGAPVDASTQARARALAGEVLTSPRGVTINTFHGWFTSLCQLAPLSSGFSRQSEPTEQTDFWMDQAIAGLTRQALEQSHTDPKCLAALNTLADHLGREGQHKVLKEALGNRVACTLVHNNPAAPGLAEVFDLLPTQHWPQAHVQTGQWKAPCLLLARALALGTPAQQAAASALERLCSATCADLPSALDVFESLCEFFLKADGEPRSGPPFKVTKGQLARADFDEAVFQASLANIQEGLALARHKASDQIDLACTEALNLLLPALFAHYQALKNEQGLCDFDDLESTALGLMMQDEQRAYMLQKLDARVRHLLVDEFQDTNPVQWSILRHWLEDYGDVDKPSVFLVGDPKQSIYRFRRAESRLFEQAKQWLKANFGAHDLYSDDTRRCSPQVVDVVNAVFAPGLVKGQTPFRPHGSLAKPLPKPWPALNLYPLVAEDDPHSEAQRCVHTLQAWLQEKRIEGLHQVLVLIQAHGSAVSLTQALREADLPYTVKDKGERYASVVWDDTLALLRFLDCPSQSLALLQLLRSPLIGLSVAHLQQLMQAGHAHQSPHVWHTVCALGQRGEAPWQALHAQLQGWLHSAKALPLFETISLVVEQTGAVQRYLNAAAPRERKLFAEHWDWLKAWALGVNKGRFPGLKQAIAEAERLAQYQGSDGDGGAPTPGVLRIMTVHSAKGLEADHVWLLDANRTLQGSGSAAGLLLDWPLENRLPRAVTVMANTRKPTAGRAAVQALDEQAYRDEEDHLLYVALTRARYSIHVSGRAQTRGASLAWYARLLPHASGGVLAWPVPATGQMDLFGGEPQESLWQRPAWPVLHPLTAPVGAVVPRIHSAELRMGTAWHAAMEHVDDWNGAGFEAWWAKRLVDCEAVFLPLSPSELGEVQQACHTLLHRPELAMYLAGATQRWNELEWTLPNGRFLRADRVVCHAGQWVVLDYKWAVNGHNLAEYTQQVLEYVALVDQTLRGASGQGNTQAALIDRHGEMHWLTSV
ncbi:MAG TPA: UvrD-helicase domain-containing protein [Limnobacter sp.]|nr:UvrD-helicase domain-containing protein [Limnobacter sp.]